MFEKESEEWADKLVEKGCVAIAEDRVRQDIQYTFQKSAEFGYNLAKEEIDYLNKHWRSEEERKANEWHYVTDKLPSNAKENGFILHDLERNSNDLPKENKQYLCKLKCFVGSGISYECLYWNNDFDYWTDKCGESICDKVICWYEIPQGE